MMASPSSPSPRGQNRRGRHDPGDGPVRVPRRATRLDGASDRRSSGEEAARRVSTISQIAARRKSGFVIRPQVWKSFKEEQKEVTGALLENAGEKISGSAIKLIEASGSAIINSGAQVQEGKGVTTDRSAAEAATGRPRERVTLGRFMIQSCVGSPETEAMLPIMKAVGKTCTAVSGLVRRAQVEGMAGLHQEDYAAGSMNVQGEVQKELDVLSNRIFLTGLCQPHDMSCVASEEEEYPRMCSKVVGEETHGGEYAAVFDPLDGSANIEAGLPCGTIFGILRTSGSAREGRTAGPSTIVLSGRRLVAAGYCLYGPSTKLVFTLGSGVFEFTLDEDVWGGSGANAGTERRGGGLGGGTLEFVLSRSNMRIPSSGKLYSVNEANSPSWPEAIQDFFLDFKTSGGSSSGSAGHPPSPDSDAGSHPSSTAPSATAGEGRLENQYVGALVADVHNILIHGGVFAYPADVKNPNGKLRLLYEGNPIAMIVEQAGGVATTGFEAIRDVRPQSVHHRIPAFFGSRDDLLPLLDPRYLHSRTGGSAR